MKKIIIALLVLMLSKFVDAQKIIIRRSSQSDECTMGYLYVNDKFIGYTLEREGKKIPTDTYSAFIRTDGPRGWRVELVNVPPNRTNIQIHIGNYPWQTTGCTLLGTSANASNCTVLGSADAMDKLEDALTDIEEGLILDENSSQKYPIIVKYE